MRIGFMPASNQDILSEIRFAKKYFDFIELTSKEDLKKYTKKYFTKIQKELHKFPVVGHVHWRINILNKKGLEKAKKSIISLKKLGAKKIIIHPYQGKRKYFKKLKKENIFSLLKLKKECKKKKVNLLIENKDKPPFNTGKSFLENFSNFNLALDTGHAFKTSSKELNKFLKLKQIKHIHLHDSKGKIDHIFFLNENKLKRLIKKIEFSGFNGTITLEIFRKIIKDKGIELESGERKKILLKHLKIIRKTLK